MVTVLVLVGVLATGALLLLSAFFSSSETAIFTAPADLVTDRSAESENARTLSRLRENPHRLLVTLLVGNNVVNVAIASLTTAIFVDRFAGGVGVVLATLFASTVVLVFGEIVPKSYGVGNPESVALRVAQPVKWVQTALYPVVVVFETVTNAINRITGGGRDIERPYVTREEIVALVETAEELGIVQSTFSQHLRTAERKLLAELFS